MTVLAQEIIRKKRDGGTLAAGEIDALIEGLTTGAVSDGQAAAFAMAVFFRGLTLDERVALTRAMTRSGTVLAWDLPGPVRRQAFDGRRRRRRQPAAGAGDRRLRRLRADDRRARPRPYRRHPRQARRRSRLCLAAGCRHLPARRSRCRLRHHRPDGRPRPGRPAPLRHPRRDRRRSNRSISSPPRSCRRSWRPGSTASSWT